MVPSGRKLTGGHRRPSPSLKDVGLVRHQRTDAERIVGGQGLGCPSRLTHKCQRASGDTVRKLRQIRLPELATKGV